MISKTAEYALRAVTSLAARVEAQASADVLAKQTKVPRRYLTRVMQRPGRGWHGQVSKRPRRRIRVGEGSR